MSEETNDPTRTDTPSVAAAPLGTAAAEHPARSPGAESGAPAASDRAPDRTPPAAKSGGGLGVALGGLVVIALVAGGAYLTRDKWLPVVGPMVGYAPRVTAMPAPAAPGSDAAAMVGSPVKVVADETPSLSPDAMAAQIDSLTAR